MLEEIATKGEGQSKTLALGVLAVHVEAMSIAKALRTITDFSKFEARNPPQQR
jgi:hypothetical protein